MPKAMNPDCEATAVLTSLNTPTTRALEQYVTREELRSLLIKILEMKGSSPGSSSASRSTISENGDEKDQEKGRVCASKMEYKTVNKVYAETHIIYWTLLTEHSWDKKTYNYKIVDSPPAQDVSELDEYVFIVHKQIYNKTSVITTSINIKSSGLQGILRVILKDIRTADLGIDKSVKQDLLYHFLPKLRKYSSPCAAQNDQDDEAMTH
ncbi:hypothetical protein DIZ76_014276 [Coccidioides immitis]|nr:hypothetical protein DIZ76_014276 [Coccidioides immitis]